MTVEVISNEFGNLGIALDQTNRMMKEGSSSTPTKKIRDEPYCVSPDCSSVSSDDSEPVPPSPSSSAIANVTVSEHKLDELAGRHAEEPLLKENPRRYVLFPIEDAEVSAIQYYLSHISCVKIITHIIYDAPSTRGPPHHY